MQTSWVLLTLFMSLWLSACLHQDTSEPNQKIDNVDLTPNLNLPENRAADFSLSHLNAQAYLDISYGSHLRQVFDIFLPSHEQPTGLIIYFHGGGFTHGDKSDFYEQANASTTIEYLLTHQLAFALVNYRLLPMAPDIDSVGVLKPMGDMLYALQFMRYFHAKLNIDKQKVALIGSSAGAGTALWISTQDDAADAHAADPIQRESSKVPVIALSSTQSSYDLVQWQQQVFTQGEWTLALDHRLQNLYGGVDQLDNLYSDARLLEYRAQVDMLAHLSADDGALYIYNTALSDQFDDPLHHPYHSEVLYNAALAAGMPVDAFIQDLNIDTQAGSKNPFLYLVNFLASD